jgi:hypothetical protein
MKIISLSSSSAGYACAVGECIKKKFYNNEYQTNMFDYLEISLLSIIQVLYLNNDDINYLHHNNDIIMNKNGDKTVIFKNFDKMISYHDLKNNYNENDYKEFIEKYKRRYYRLIDYIKNEDKIYFIRYGFEEMNTINDFFKIVHIINPSLCIHFININNSESLYIPLYQIENYYYINFYDYIDKNIKYDDDPYFKTFQFNWAPVFDIIYKQI